MAVTIDAISHSAGTWTNVGTYSWVHVVGTGLNQSALFVTAQVRDSNAIGNGLVTNVTWNPGAIGTLIKDTSQQNPGDGLWSHIWHILAPNAGTGTITVTLAGTAVVETGGAVSFSGVNQNTPTDGTAGAYGEGFGLGTAYVTTTVQNDFILDSLYQKAGGTAVPGTSQTKLFELFPLSTGGTTGDGSGDTADSSYQLTTIPAVYQEKYTFSASDDFVMATVAITPSISCSNLDSGGGALNASSQTTNTKSPGSNKLEMLVVKSRTSSSINPNTPTVTGCGLTWVQIDSIVTDDIGGARQRMTLFRTMGISPSTGALTIDFGGQSQTHSCYIWDELSSIDTTGVNGAGAIVQEVNANQPASSFDSNAQSSITATLAAFSSINNATYAVFGNGNTTETLTNGTGFSTVVDFADTAGGSMELRTLFDASNQTAVTMNFSPNDAEDGIFGMEIKLATTITSTGNRTRLGLLGVG